MTDKNIQMTQRNSTNTAWENLFPRTKAENVVANNGSNLESHLADYVRQPGYGTTEGSANIYTLHLTPALTTYIAGVCVAVRIHAANTGASTINVNGLGVKSIRDSKGNALTSGKLVLNSIYTLRYDGTNFILQGEGASGNAVASDLLSGKTASVDAGDIVGTMPNRGTVNITPSVISQSIPLGYHSGLGVVHAANLLTTWDMRPLFQPNSTTAGSSPWVNVFEAGNASAALGNYTGNIQTWVVNEGGYIVTTNMIDVTNVRFIVLDKFISRVGTSFLILSTTKNASSEVFNFRTSPISSGGFTCSGALNVTAITGNFFFRYHNIGMSLCNVLTVRLIY